MARLSTVIRCTLTLGLLLCAASPLAGQQGSAASPQGTGETPGLVGELLLLPSSFLHTVSAPGDWDSAAWQAVPSWIGGLAGISLLDEWAREVTYRPVPRELDTVLTTVEPFGVEGSFAVLGGFYAAGLVLDDRRARAVALEGLGASALAGGIITPALQLITGRKRPRHSAETHEFDPFSGNIGFPSGHVTQAFAVASVIATEYDAWWVDGLAYGVATGVGLHRMVHGAHHLSDVAAGALVGTVVGRSVARFGQTWRGERVLLPYTGPGLVDGTNVGLSLSF